MENITLETLPKAFFQLSVEVSEIKRLLIEQQIPNQIPTDQWFDLNELCTYHPDKPSKPTVYGWVHNNSIPCHKGAKKLRFLKSEIDNWIKSGRKKTISETGNEAQNYINRKAK